jgi:hypothetical protein
VCHGSNNLWDWPTQIRIKHEVVWLVVWNMFCYFSIDELHHFSRWLLHHQPVVAGRFSHILDVISMATAHHDIATTW